MTTMALHIAPDDSFDDWVLRDDTGRELGHFPTREAAERMGQQAARAREADLVIHLPDGRTSCTRFRRSWLNRILRG